MMLDGAEECQLSGPIGEFGALHHASRGKGFEQRTEPATAIGHEKLPGNRENFVFLTTDGRWGLEPRSQSREPETPDASQRKS